MRWFPRINFSLRTLLLLVLALASAATLWWNWGPWVPLATIEEPGLIQNIWFSDDDQFIFVCYQNHLDNARYHLDVLNAQTGVRYRLLEHAAINPWFGPGGAYVWSNLGEPNYMDIVYNFDTGKQLIYDTPKYPINQMLSTPSVDGNLIVLHMKDSDVLARLPAIEPVETFPRGTIQQFDHDTLTLLDGQHITIRDVNTGAVMATMMPPEHFNIQSVSTMPHYMIANGRLQEPQGGTKEEIIYSLNQKKWLGKLPPLRGGISSDGQRTLWFDYSKSPWKFKVLNVETRQETVLGTSTLEAYNGQFSRNDQLIWDGQGSMYDANALQKLWDRPNSIGQLSPTSEVIYVADSKVDPHSSDAMFDARYGQLIMKLSGPRLPNLEGPLTDVVWANYSLNFISWHGRIANPKSERTTRATLFRLHRPIVWYGPACLPEFWLTFFFSIGLLWSLFRDRKNA